MAARAKNWKIFKRLLCLNQWMDLKVINQEYSLDDPLSKLLKQIRSVEQNCRQGCK